MGCFKAKPILPEDTLTQTDGKLRHTFQSGGLKLASGNVLHLISNGTLFITDKKIIHVHKSLGLNRIEFDINSIKDLKGTEAINASCFTAKTKTYVYFKAKIDGGKFYVRIKIFETVNVQDVFSSHLGKNKQKTLNVIEEERES